MIELILEDELYEGDVLRVVPYVDGIARPAYIDVTLRNGTGAMVGLSYAQLRKLRDMVIAILDGEACSVSP